MDDLENINESNDVTKPIVNEEMGSPASNNIAGKVFFGVVIAAVLVLIVVSGQDDNKEKTVTDIGTEEISNEDKKEKEILSTLKIPEDEKKKTIKQQLATSAVPKKLKTQIQVKEEPERLTPTQKVAKLVGGGREDNSYEKAQLKKEQQRIKQINERRNSTMNQSKGSSSDKISELEGKKRDALNFRDQVLNGKLGGLGATQNVNSNNKTDVSLLSLPASQTVTVMAENLLDTEYLITEGTVIQATIETAINSTLPGKIRAIVNSPVYSYTGNARLIDKKSELIGEYRSATSGGEPRIFVIWTRLITSDGITLRLDSPGIDNLGQSGVGGWSDTHFMKRFGSSVMLSLIGGFAQNESTNNGQAAALSDSFNKSAEIALENSINIKPTVKLNQGARVAVFVNQDINFVNALSKRKIKRLERNNRNEETISYDRVFNKKPLTSKERLMLGNRFIKDRNLVSGQSYTQKPYIAEKGESLRAVIKRWASRNSYYLNWDVIDAQGNKLDWELVSDVTIHGTLFDVVDRVLTAYKRADVDINHKFYNKNQVLEITGSDLDE